MTPTLVPRDAEVPISVFCSPTLCNMSGSTTLIIRRNFMIDRKVVNAFDEALGIGFSIKRQPKASIMDLLPVSFATTVTEYPSCIAARLAGCR